jgi:hypothetical protein
MYDAVAKVAVESVSVSALLAADVLVASEPRQLKSVLSGESTLLLFVRNGA